jgi:hypothetical protein
MVTRSLLIGWRVLLLVVGVVVTYRAFVQGIAGTHPGWTIALWIALIALLPGHFHKW